MIFYTCRLWQRMKMLSWHREKSVDYLLFLEYCPSLSNICKLTFFPFVRSTETLPCLIWRNHRTKIAGHTNSGFNCFLSGFLILFGCLPGNWRGSGAGKLKNGGFFSPKVFAFQNATSQSKQEDINRHRSMLTVPCGYLVKHGHIRVGFILLW